MVYCYQTLSGIFGFFEVAFLKVERRFWKSIQSLWSHYVSPGNSWLGFHLWVRNPRPKRGHFHPTWKTSGGWIEKRKKKERMQRRRRRKLRETMVKKALCLFVSYIYYLFHMFNQDKRTNGEIMINLDLLIYSFLSNLITHFQVSNRHLLTSSLSSIRETESNI